MSAAALVERLRAIVGSGHVLTAERETRRYRHGYRFGKGAALAVVRPATLVEQWRVFRAIVAADAILIAQAANTGLTGGSTPDGDYDRPVVIVSTSRVRGIHLLHDGRQAVCLAGATLDALERKLQPLGREPHSVIGSSCIGASVIGGICNNSGGALIQRGPAFTQYALYGRVNAQGEAELVNHLGVALGDAPETILARLEAGRFDAADVADLPGRAASDGDYQQRVRDVAADTPARYNADPDRLFEASGSAGKLMVFAVRVDSFPRPQRSAVFYIGTNDPAALTRLRRDMLGGFRHLPEAAEYLHRTCFDIARDYGKDSFLAIRLLGTHRIARFFDWKGRIDGWLAGRGPPYLTDRLLQALGRCWPDHLPARMNDYRDRFEHHLILRMADDGIEEARQWFAAADRGLSMFECTADEAEKALLHRFVAAGAAVRYRAVHHRAVADIVSLDIALPRNTAEWTETLPDELAGQMIHRLYYGHFFCHVLHQDYVIARPHDPHAVEAELLRLLDARGARYPAEHNVGHLYQASAAQAAHFRALDPCNCMNPGIGQMSRERGWEDAEKPELYS